MTSHAPTSASRTADIAASRTERLELAGMAMRSGVLVIGPTHWAAAVRADDGEIDVAVRRRWAPRESLLVRVPVLRGPVRLVQMLGVLPAVRRALPDSRFGFESRQLLLGSLLGSIAVRWVKHHHGEGPVADLVGSGASLAMTLVAMRGGDVARYHGAEHKAIRGYELGIPSQRAPKEHPRCGTQLAIPLLVLSAIATQVAMRAMPNSPRSARIIGQLAGIGLATELFRASQRGRGAALARGVQWAGLRLQSAFTVAEPSPDQLAVGDAALTALLVAEQRERSDQRASAVSPPANATGSRSR